MTEFFSLDPGLFLPFPTSFLHPFWTNSWGTGSVCNIYYVFGPFPLKENVSLSPTSPESQFVMTTATTGSTHTAPAGEEQEMTMKKGLYYPRCQQEGIFSQRSSQTPNKLREDASSSLKKGLVIREQRRSSWNVESIKATKTRWLTEYFCEHAGHGKRTVEE
ncbi:hypothetical protein K435DRAFT_880061 [Dendrothele bispora CBS 962.96]|uniref:Uncharacterized protein n=1 Tax=Dendrothele bispora (strain CBS 962.96) TaxID=1314807 RepID=A0A4V4HAK4_DENBC|nr:hypothetical protein K435DRAFT_880061 [Dendrothele bispora CBS 962.96]